MIRIRTRGVAAAFLAVVFAFATTLPALAFTTMSQGYAATEKLVPGSLVSLKENGSDTVVGASTKTAATLLGVVINNGSSLLTVENGKNQVQVATNGVVPALISNVNGDIAEGDPITASPIAGVGMKATVNTKVIGIAQTGMSGKQQQKAKDESGKEIDVTLGQTDLMVSVSYHYKQPDKTIIPAALQNVADSLAGHKVDSTPIIISAIIFVIMLATVSSIIYAMIRSSIISVGRNPMAQGAVYRNLIQLSLLVLMVIGVSTVAIYLVLTRL